MLHLWISIPLTGGVAVLSGLLSIAIVKKVRPRIPRVLAYKVYTTVIDTLIDSSVENSIRDKGD